MLSSPDHAASARAVGIYGHLLHYVQRVQAGTSGGLALPGEAAPPPARTSTALTVAAQPQSQAGPSSRSQAITRASDKGNEKAMNYFSACLRILELEEEVALTPESLKSAYKKAVVRAHPDKGGSEKEFEAVTRAYAYLGEILRRIHGGRAKEGVVEAPNALQSTRATEADAWKHVEPVRLNPDKLDVKTFNKMFEQTRIPDPEEQGYGDWLKGEDAGGGAAAAPKFSGKFNREVFQRAFEEEMQSKRRGGGDPRAAANGAIVAQEMSLASRIGYATELGRTGRDDYTVAANDPGLKYTDLKKAYTEYNTFSQQTAGVRVESRNLEQYSRERDKAPAPLQDAEMAALQEAEKQAAAAEERRKLRMAQEAIEEGNYFERMKRLVLR